MTAFLMGICFSFQSTLRLPELELVLNFVFVTNGASKLARVYPEQWPVLLAYYSHHSSLVISKGITYDYSHKTNVICLRVQASLTRIVSYKTVVICLRVQATGFFPLGLQCLIMSRLQNLPEITRPVKKWMGQTLKVLLAPL
jgi:hypothetical protein